jgi:hypothetical protein
MNPCPFERVKSIVFKVAMSSSSRLAEEPPVGHQTGARFLAKLDRRYKELEGKKLKRNRVSEHVRFVKTTAVSCR